MDYTYCTLGDFDLSEHKETVSSIHIMELFRKEKRSFRIMEIDELLRKKGYKHNRVTLGKNLNMLSNQRKIVKKKWMGFFRYGIPEKRLNGSWFIVVKDADTPETIFELEE